MKSSCSSHRNPLLRITAVGLVILAAFLFTLSAIGGKTDGSPLPAGSAIGGVPVGGLSLEQAAAQVQAVFMQPLELRYRDQMIQVNPQQLGFALNLDAMLAAANRVSSPTLWDRLWNRDASILNIPLDSTVDGATLRTFLENEVAVRYDQPAHPTLPIPGTTNFNPGTSGWQMDIPQSAVKITSALTTPENRIVDLIIKNETTVSGDLADLQIFLQQTISNSRFTGIAEVYLANPANGDILHFAIENGQDIQPDIAYSAASTMKIPIMVSVLRRTSDPAPADVQNLLERMIVLSENPPADTLMENVIGGTLAPLEVSRDMQDKLGLKNTFLAGYFYFGAPLLDLFHTPANSRTDVNLDPDIYNQTTTSDMGRLLTGIYQCSRGEPNILTQAFGGEITPQKCTTMLDILAQNEIGVLSEAGVPDGTRVAHKHGWTEEADGYLHTVSDAGIVFTPGGDFVFVIFLYDRSQLLFDPADAVIAQLVQVIYNYYNPQAQTFWLGERVFFPQR